MSMRRREKKIKTDWVWLSVLIVVSLLTVGAQYSFTPPSLSFQSTPFVAVVRVNDTTIHVPSWQLFRSDGLWVLVSKDHHLPDTFTPRLITTDVPHTSSANMVEARTAGPLMSLLAKAHESGVELMLSSAYRSYDAQKSLAATVLSMRGAAYVQSYVAPAGTSEHQTGLAVDLATSSLACMNNPDACSLDPKGIAWLRVHAADYGFIERYPSGKQSVTGIAGEHWHYRYVGVPLARALLASGMTLDEFVLQTAPGYAR